MKPKKVAILYSGARVPGGLEAHLLSLFKHYNPQDIDLSLISLGHWSLPEDLEGMGQKVVFLPGKRIRIRTIFGIADILKKENADLVASQNMVDNFYAGMASRLAKVPHLITAHSYYKNDYPGLKRRILFRLIELSLKNRTKMFVAVSEFIKQTLEKRGIPEQKIRVVYNAVEPIWGIEPRERGKEITIGSLGRLHPVKGYDILIKALKILENEPVRLVIFGKGEAKKEFESLAKELGIRDRIDFDYAESVADALNKIDIYVQPSRSEGFGLALANAMLAGKPVVVTPAGSLPEIVANGETGLITGDFTPEALAREIQKLFHDGKLAQKLGESAQREISRRFNTANWIENITQVYLEAAK